MDKQTRKSPTFVAIVIAIIAAILAGLGALTGAAVVFGIGIIAMFVTLAAASIAHYKTNRTEQRWETRQRDSKGR